MKKNANKILPKSFLPLTSKSEFKYFKSSNVEIKRTIQKKLFHHFCPPSNLFVGLSNSIFCHPSRFKTPFPAPLKVGPQRWWFLRNAAKMVQWYLQKRNGSTRIPPVRLGVFFGIFWGKIYGNIKNIMSFPFGSVCMSKEIRFPWGWETYCWYGSKIRRSPPEVYKTFKMMG